MIRKGLRLLRMKDPKPILLVRVSGFNPRGNPLCGVLGGHILEGGGALARFKKGKSSDKKSIKWLW